MESITIPVPPTVAGAERRVTVQWHVPYGTFLELAKQHGLALEDIRNTRLPHPLTFCSADLVVDGVNVVMFGHPEDHERITVDVGQVAS